MAQVASIFNNAHTTVNRNVLPVIIEPSQLRPIAFRIFTKKYNLTLKSDALKLLASHVGIKCGQTWRSSCEPILDEIAKSWSRTQDVEPIVSEAGLVPIIKSLDVAHVPRPSTLAREDTMMIDATAPAPVIDDASRYLTYIDAFAQPIYHYSHIRQAFELEKSSSLLPDAVIKPRLWLERYHFLRARILRHESFQAPSFHQSGTFHKLTQIKNLLGRQGKSFMLFGLLTVGNDSNYYLEDADDTVRLDFTGASCGGGWFCPGCFVLVDGLYTEEEVFHVSVMGQPPPEPREQTREVYSGIDMLGTGIEKSQERHLARTERANLDARIIFCADCHLDDAKSLKAIRTMLTTYEIAPPLAIVMLGNFSSSAQHTNGASAQYKEYWDDLAAILDDFPKLCQSTKFVFVPGSNDPWSLGGVTILPRRPISKAFTNRVQRACKDVVFATNPCRLAYYTQEIVICRDSMVERLRRTNLTIKGEDEVLMHDDQETQQDTQAQVFLTPSAPPPADSAARTVVRTIIDQSHLSPFPIATRPIYWSHSSSLRLFPSPTLLVLADTAMTPYSLEYNATLAVNPSSMKSGKHAQWIEYAPAAKSAETMTSYIY